MPPSLRNALIVARREYVIRARSRAFVLSTILLMVITAGLAAAPIAITLLQGRDTSARVAVHVGPNDAGDVAARLAPLLNRDPSRPAFSFSAAPDLAAARQAVVEGRLAGALDVERGPGGDLAFTYYANGTTPGQAAALLGQAANAIGIQDRLTRAGIAPASQASIFAPVGFQRLDADPAKAGQSAVDRASSGSLAFALGLIIFMAIVLYGQWIATSVAEEKSSRVMEVMLSAASPTQLLAGKVLGVSGLALSQYVLVALPAGLVLLLQGQLSALVLGSAAPAAGLPEGLSGALLVVFGLFFVLGFGLYAVLYAAGGSLVSRQEDLNQVVGPLTMLATVGYLLATWSATGLISLDRGPLAALAYVPFLSPYLMVVRFGSGTAGPLELAVALVILVLSIGAALWVAVRVYAAGVLLYGQRPGLRKLWTAMRTSR